MPFQFVVKETLKLLTSDMTIKPVSTGYGTTTALKEMRNESCHMESVNSVQVA